MIAVAAIAASAETGGYGSRQYTVTWTAPEGVKATDCTVIATCTAQIDIQTAGLLLIVR